MIIERIYSIERVLECVPFEVEIRNKHRDASKVQKMLLFVQSQFENPMFGFWIASEENILGYAVAMISLVPGGESLIILRLYAKIPKVRDGLIEELKQFAKQFGVKTARITVRKNVKALTRKYKFKPVSINMERKIWET